MSVEMTAGVLVADMLEGMRFGLGPTMATRKDALAAIGGVGALGDYCADDYVLGQRTHAAGRTVVLSHHVIEHVAVNRSVRASLQHHLRWMRSTRFSRPLGHLGAGLTFAMPFGILALVAGLADSRAGLAFALFGWALVNRVVQRSRRAGCIRFGICSGSSCGAVASLGPAFSGEASGTSSNGAAE
jgi:ceramide glucosyltransferase